MKTKEEGSQRHAEKASLACVNADRTHSADLADIGRSDAGALPLAEGHVQGELDGQARHGSRGQWLDLGHSLNQASFGAVRLKRHLNIAK